MRLFLAFAPAGANEFWWLRYFINAKFSAKLRSYRESNSQSAPAVIASIEANA